MRNLKAILLGSAAFACIGIASETAHAQSYAFGAGATFPQIVYRELFDCAFDQLQGGGTGPGPRAKALACSSFNQAGIHGLMVYAPTGSGNGKASLLSNLPSTIGTPGTTIPFTDTTIGVSSAANYDGIQFAGSDDVVNPADVANWAARGSSSNQTKFGNLIQIPALIGVVGIGFNGKDGAGNPLTILPATPSVTVPGSSTPLPGSSGLNLSRTAVCGIFSGHITQWDNAVLTKLNTATPGGVGTTPYGHGNITVVHRQDGSGTTFLLSNALATQCQFEFGANSESDPTIVSYAFPWTDHAAAACPFPVAHGANQLNWPDQFSVDQCTPSHTVTNPGGGHFSNASGTGALVSLVASTNGAIGYASADFWLPVKTTGLATANIQSQWDVTLGTNKFQPPTWYGGQVAMDSVTPVFDDTTRPNPLAWSLQGVVPNAGVKDAYPISGFTWIEMYQCYQVHANGNNPLHELLTSLNFMYGSSSTGYPIENANGFANVPYRWLVEIYTLLNHPTYGPNYAGTGSCASTTPGAY